MTQADILSAIAEIKELAKDDNENAHIKEDQLYYSVLRAIANGTAENAQEWASLVLTTKDFDFDRWYA
jgi:hypothetical protein